MNLASETVIFRRANTLRRIMPGENPKIGIVFHLVDRLMRNQQ
jgi:hypothetical protein